MNESMNGAEAEIRVGNCYHYQQSCWYTNSNIEMYPGKGGQLVRSAGNSAQLMAKEGYKHQIPSGEMNVQSL